MFFPFFCYCNNFFLYHVVSWKEQSCKFLPFSFCYCNKKKILYHVVSWKEQISKFLPFFMPSLAKLRVIIFFLFKLCFVWTKCNVRYACLSWCFSCGRAEKEDNSWLESFRSFFCCCWGNVFEKCYLGKGRILYLSIWLLVNGRPICLQKERWYLFLGRIVLPCRKFFPSFMASVNEVF